jgi:hypothetical protein
MQPSTIATLEALEAADWFSRVGVKDAETAIDLSSWSEAIEHSDSYEWECLRNEVMNQYRALLMQRSMERWRLWNDVVVGAKELTKPLVERKIAAVVREHNLPGIFEARVGADILRLCIESEYADVCPPGFFTAHAHWYLNGHFPCGWKGEFPPKGPPVIY